MIGELIRTKDEIKEECLEIAKYKSERPQHFGQLTYEDGVQAAMRWLFFTKEPAPSDLSPKPKPVQLSFESLVVSADPSGDY